MCDEGSYEDGLERGWGKGFAAALDELESRVNARSIEGPLEITEILEIVDKMKGGTGE